MRLKIKRSDILFCICTLIMFIFLLDIDYLGNFSWTIIIKSVIFVILVLEIFFNKQKIYISTILIGIGYLLILFSTVINGRNLKTAFIVFVAPMAMLLLFNYGLNKNAAIFISAIKIVLLILVMANFVSVILFPNGMYLKGGYSANWILGYKNVHVRYIIPYIAINIGFNKRENHLKLFDYFMLVIGTATCILAKASTGVGGMVLFTLLIISNEFRGKITKKFIKFLLNPLFIFGVIVFAYVIILFGNDSFLAEIVQALFNKDLTFTGRTRIWVRCIEYIKTSPIFGMGYINSEAFYRLINVGAGAHPHNYPIGIAFYGGFSALAVFLSEYVYIFKNYKTTMSKRTKVIFWSIISFLVMGITDVCLMAALFHPMLILFEYKCINDEKA